MTKQKLLLSSAAGAIIYLSISGYVTGLKDHTTNCSSCHGLASGKTFCSVSLREKSTGMLVTDGRYKANTLYELTLNGYNKDSNSKFGFRVVITNKDTTKAGTLTTSDTANTFIINKGTMVITGHRKIHIATKPGIFSATFDWLSPTAGSKSINFHSVINSVNADNSSSGDFLSDEIVEKFEEIVEAKIIEKEKIQLNLYPNPTNKTLHITHQSQHSFNTCIYDLSGHLQITSNDSNEIDVSFLSSGVYLLRLNTEDGQQTATFVKQ